MCTCLCCVCTRMQHNTIYLPTGRAHLPLHHLVFTPIWQCEKKRHAKPQRSAARQRKPQSDDQQRRSVWQSVPLRKRQRAKPHASQPQSAKLPPRRKLQRAKRLLEKRRARKPLARAPHAAAVKGSARCAQNKKRLVALFVLLVTWQFPGRILATADVAQLG